MSVYFTDVVRITNVTTDIDGAETKGTPFTSKAYVEDDGKIRYGSDGQPIAPETLIVLPKGVTITEGDIIAIVKLRGITVSGNDAVDKKVRAAPPVGSFTPSHIEVVV